MIISFRCKETREFLRLEPLAVGLGLSMWPQESWQCSMLPESSVTFAPHREIDWNSLMVIGMANIAFVSMTSGGSALFGLRPVLRKSRLSTTTDITMRRELLMITYGMRPIHPGEVLREEFMEPLALSSSALARALNVSVPTVNQLVLERRGVSSDMALRLARYFDTTAEFWMNLQTSYTLAVTAAEKGDEIEHDIQPYATAV